jgi:hypothetical protein
LVLNLVELRADVAASEVRPVAARMTGAQVEVHPAMVRRVVGRLVALTLMAACMALEVVGVRDEPGPPEANPVETSWWRYR